MTTKLFQIVAVSSNTNSFGLNGVVIVARDGLAFEFGTCNIYSKLAVGQHAELSLVPENELSNDSVACFDWSTIRLRTGERFTVEIPRALPECPKKVVKTFWRDPANTQDKASLNHPRRRCTDGYGV